MMVYKYRLHDPDSGKVLYEGTAADLAAQGVVVSEKVLPTLWRDQQRQHKRRGKHRWDITREKVEVACSRKAYKVRLKPKKTENAQAKPPRRPTKPKGGRRTDAETGGTQEAPGAAEEVPDRPDPAAAGRAGAGRLQRQGPGAWKERAELWVLGSRGKTGCSGMVKPVCTPDCPDRHPACSDRCEKYRAWKAEVQKEKTYTKSQNDAGKINRNDFDAEFWMGGKHK